MAKRHRDILAKLDPLAVARYQITEKDLRTIERYLKIIQANLSGVSTWQDILDFAGPYATSIVIHEIVEIRRLAAVWQRTIRPMSLHFTKNISFCKNTFNDSFKRSSRLRP